MAVFSNKPDEFTRLCVTRLLSGWHFQAVQGATPALPRKPDPRGAWRLPRGLGIAPGEVLYLGDTNTDMQTAVAAGMFPVGRVMGISDGRRTAGHGRGRAGENADRRARLAMTEFASPRYPKRMSLSKIAGRFKKSLEN